MKRSEIQANGPSLGPNSGFEAFRGFKLSLQRSYWSHGGDHIRVLATRFGAVLREGGQRPGSVPGSLDCG